MRTILVAGWLALIFTSIINLFWINEWKYSLPTPVPKGYVSTLRGSEITWDKNLFSDNSKPAFFHFYNPDCPCSRFNIPHFKSLEKKYNKNINFAVVVLNKNKNYTSTEIQDKLDLEIPVILDQEFAKACGVYSTPQAVLTDSNHNLYYRGNYNKSRYCTTKSSNYAEMAIDSLLKNKVHPMFNKNALQAYGCELPNCTK